MNVTRREMLTTASTVGLTTALTHGTSAEAGPSTTKAAALDAAATLATNLHNEWWSRIAADNDEHLCRAAHIISTSASVAFREFTFDDLKRIALKADTPVRGYYVNDENGTDVNKLAIVYVYSQTGATFKIHAVGAKGMPATRCVELIHSDIINTFFEVSDTHKEMQLYRGRFTDNKLIEAMLNHISLRGDKARYTLTKDRKDDLTVKTSTLTLRRL